MEDLSPLRGGELIKSVKKGGGKLFSILNIKVHILNIDLLFKGSQCRDVSCNRKCYKNEIV